MRSRVAVRPDGVKCWGPARGGVHAVLAERRDDARRIVRRDHTGIPTVAATDVAGAARLRPP
jgi:hypothetical protein